jgi:hypothetical protein
VLGKPFPPLSKNLFMLGFPRSQFVAGIANFDVIEQFGGFKVKLGAVMFDLFSYLENLKYVEFSLHYSTFGKKALSFHRWQSDTLPSLNIIKIPDLFCEFNQISTVFLKLSAAEVPVQ